MIVASAGECECWGAWERGSVGSNKVHRIALVAELVLVPDVRDPCPFQLRFITVTLTV